MTFFSGGAINFHVISYMRAIAKPIIAARENGSSLTFYLVDLFVIYKNILFYII